MDHDHRDDGPHGPLISTLCKCKHEMNKIKKENSICRIVQSIPYTLAAQRPFIGRLRFFLVKQRMINDDSVACIIQ